MTLVVLTVVVIVLFVAVLGMYLFVIGGLLNRTADNLGDCLQSVRTVAGQANVIGPGVKRINKAGGEIVGALPLLVDDAERVAAKLAPSAATPPVSSSAAIPEAAPTRVGYLDV